MGDRDQEVIVVVEICGGGSSFNHTAVLLLRRLTEINELILVNLPFACSV